MNEIIGDVILYAIRFRCSLVEAILDWEGDGPNGSFGLNSNLRAQVATALRGRGFNLEFGFRDDQLEASFSLCDVLNPRFGYQVRISSGRTGNNILFTSVDPFTGRDLVTASDCLRVIGSMLPPSDCADNNA